MVDVICNSEEKRSLNLSSALIFIIFVSQQRSKLVSLVFPVLL